MSKEYDADARDDGKCAYISEDLERPCQHGEAWGYPNATSGFCSAHGDRGGQEGNSNAEGNSGGDGAETKHGLYAQVNKFYSKTISDDLRELCDDIFEDYCDEYQDRHGELRLTHETRLFQIAVNHVKIIYSDNWAEDRPEMLKRSGSPLVDEDHEIVPVGEMETEIQVSYSESVLVATQQKLRREDRQWLKSMGLLEHDPDTRQADALQDGIDLSLSAEDKDALDAAFGGD